MCKSCPPPLLLLLTYITCLLLGTSSALLWCPSIKMPGSLGWNLSSRSACGQDCLLSSAMKWVQRKNCQAQDQEVQGAGSPSQSHLPGQHGPLAAARSMHEGSTQDPTILNQCAQGQRRIGCSAATSPLVPRVHCSVEREGADSLAARTGPSHLHRTQGTKGDVAEHKGKELSQQCRQPFC